MYMLYRVSQFLVSGINHYPIYCDIKNLTDKLFIYIYIYVP